MPNQDHWDAVYRTKQSDSVSWYQPSPRPSLEAIERYAIGAAPSLIDVGGGASNLVDALLKRGWADLTVLDIADPALDVARQRLGDDARRVTWTVADIVEWQPPQTYDVWHDRAVFHFLTTPEQRQGYKKALAAGTAPGSVVILSTFALDGPEKCSGLVVQRYDAGSLSRELGSCFQLLDSWHETHITPGGSDQAFNWCVFKRGA